MSYGVTSVSARADMLILLLPPFRTQDYVHQIGRTGRSGKTGIATTFVNMQTAEQTLLDLKYLLMEAKQK